MKDNRTNPVHFAEQIHISDQGHSHHRELSLSVGHCLSVNDRDVLLLRRHVHSMSDVITVNRLVSLGLHLYDLSLCNVIIWLLLGSMARRTITWTVMPLVMKAIVRSRRGLEDPPENSHNEADHGRQTQAWNE